MLDALGPFHMVMLQLHRHGRERMMSGALHQPTLTEIEVSGPVEFTLRPAGAPFDAR